MTHPANDTTRDRLGELGVVPIVIVDDPALSTPLADSLVAGGLGCIEVTLRTAAGLPTIANMASRGDILVGAGTVTTVRQVDEAVDAGANFIVSPGFTVEIVNRARERGVLMIPGIATASELQAAVNMDLTVVKLFPAHVLGGLPLIDAFAGPFPSMLYMPSGGITPTTASDYLNHPSVLCVGASWIAPRDLINAHDFGNIQARASESGASLRKGRVS